MAGRLAVIGSGLMGSGIAQVSAQAGWQVTMRDVDDAAARARHVGDPRLARAGSPPRARSPQEDAEATLGRITPTTDLDAAADADVVVEAIYEKARGQARGLPCARQDLQGRRGARHQHVGDPDHPDRGGHRAARVGRRHPLLLAGADDEAGRAGPRLPDLGRHAGHRPQLRRGGRQDLRRGEAGRGRLRLQPALLGAAGRGDQAGRVGRGLGRRPGHGDEAGLRSRHGPARHGGPDRPGRHAERGRATSTATPRTRSSSRRSCCSAWSRPATWAARPARASTRTEPSRASKCAYHDISW